jgi:hypothetical protein
MTTEPLPPRTRLVLLLQVLAFLALFIAGGLLLAREPERPCEYRECSAR